MKRLRVAFMGSPEFAVSSLQATARECDVAMVFTQPDRPAGRGQKLTPCAVKVAALELGLPVRSPEKLRDAEVVTLVRELDLDLIVVVAYGKILPKVLLELPRFGCVNVHASLLPRWRGAAPIQRAMLAGDRVTGVCIMQLDEGCDTGPVYMREPLVIDPGETAGALTQRLALLGGKTLQRFLQNFEQRGRAQSQDEALAVHAAKLNKSEGWTDWSRPAAEVNAHIRGMDPWPGAFAELDGETLKLFGARMLDRQAQAEWAAGAPQQPGQILAIGDEGLLIACGDLAVWVLEVQAPGKKRLPGQTFAAGHGLAAGRCFVIDPMRSQASAAAIKQGDGHHGALN